VKQPRLKEIKLKKLQEKLAKFKKEIKEKNELIYELETESLQK